MMTKPHPMTFLILALVAASFRHVSLSSISPTLTIIIYNFLPNFSLYLYHLLSPLSYLTLRSPPPMEINHVSSFRHRSSPSSDRFLGLYKTTTATDSILSGDELHESEVFFTPTDSSYSTRRSTSPLSRRNLGFRKSGILAALSDDGGGGVVLPSTTPFRAIPKPPPVQNQRVTGELTQSAPINVPLAMMKSRRSNRTDRFENGDEDKDEDEEEAEMLPPHEIVAMKVKATSSVLEGAGRTLKGRDLRQVRNAVWSRIGFVD